MLIFVGWLPPYLRPSGACLDLGTRVCFSLLTPSRVAPNRGCVSSDERSKPRADGFRAFNGLGLGSQGYLPGNSPYKRTQFPCDGDNHLVGVFPAADQPPIAFAQPHLGLPTDILKRFRQRFEAQLEMAADLGRIAVRPGPFDQHPPGMGVARLGDASLATSVSTGVFRGDETEITHELSRVVKTGEVAQFRHEGDGHGELDAA